MLLTTQAASSGTLKSDVPNLQPQTPSHTAQASRLLVELADVLLNRVFGDEAPDADALLRPRVSELGCRSILSGFIPLQSLHRKMHVYTYTYKYTNVHTHSKYSLYEYVCMQISIKIYAYTEIYRKGVYIYIDMQN